MKSQETENKITEKGLPEIKETLTDGEIIKNTDQSETEADRLYALLKKIAEAEGKSPEELLSSLEKNTFASAQNEKAANASVGSQTDRRGGINPEAVEFLKGLWR